MVSCELVFFARITFAHFMLPFYVFVTKRSAVQMNSVFQNQALSQEQTCFMSLNYSFYCLVNTRQIPFLCWKMLSEKI